MISYPFQFWDWLRGLLQHYWSRVSDHLDDDEDVDQLPDLPNSEFPHIAHIPPSRESTKISENFKVNDTTTFTECFGEKKSLTGIKNVFK